MSTAQEIKRAVAKHFNISVAELDSARRRDSICFARHVAMYLCRELTPLSYPEIGVLFGGRHHTTVIHGCDKIAKAREENPDQAAELALLAQPFAERALPEIIQNVKVPDALEERIIARAAVLAATRIAAKFDTYLRSLAERQNDLRLERAITLDEAMKGLTRASEALEAVRYSPRERGARQKMEQAVRLLSNEYRGVTNAR